MADRIETITFLISRQSKCSATWLFWSCDAVGTSYSLTAINSVTRSTAIHTFHNIGICLWINMPVTSPKYIPLNKYCSLPVDPHYCIYKKTGTFIYHAITTYLPKSNVFLKCHISAKLLHDTYENAMLVYRAQINSMQSIMWPDTLVYIHFILLAYALEQIQLPHCSHVSYCTSVLVCL